MIDLGISKDRVVDNMLSLSMSSMPKGKITILKGKNTTIPFLTIHFKKDVDYDSYYYESNPESIYSKLYYIDIDKENNGFKPYIIKRESHNNSSKYKILNEKESVDFTEKYLKVILNGEVKSELITRLRDYKIKSLYL